MSYNVVSNHPKYAPGQTVYIIENGLHPKLSKIILGEQEPSIRKPSSHAGFKAF